MTKASRRPGPESTLEEVRSQLVAAGVELLRTRGVDVGLGEISLSDTIAAAGVTRSTAYRSLADEELAPQAVLHRDLMTWLLTRYTRGDNRTSLEGEINAELDRHAEALASGDPAQHTLAMRGVIRVGSNASYRNVIESPERSILTSIYGALQSSGQHDWRHDALAEGESGLTALFIEFYDGLRGLFHYEIKAPMTMAQFTTAGASLVEGMAMRHGVNDEIVMIKRPTGPDNSLEEWSLFAIAFEAMFIGMFEPSDPQNPFADLLRW